MVSYINTALIVILIILILIIFLYLKKKNDGHDYKKNEIEMIVLSKKLKENKNWRTYGNK